MRLWMTVKEAMLKKPDQILIESNAAITYEECVVYAEHFSKQLKGVSSCAILCGSELSAALALLACFAAEVTAVPLSIRYGWQHCEKILDTISPEAVITDADGKLQVMFIEDARYAPPQEHPALIMCTSGTTGQPKGVMLSEQNVLANLYDICDYFDIKKEDAILIARPLYHCAVLTGEFLTALLKGCRICFYSGAFNPKVLLELLVDEKITTFCGTPTMLKVLASIKKEKKLPSLKNICISGECMSCAVGREILKGFPQASIYHVYGQTEASPRICYLPPEAFAHFSDYVGVPLKGVSYKIIKEDGTVAKKGEAGMLWISGDNVMLGYYNDPRRTAKVLQDQWLCTGDIATLNQKGYLKIKGRKDDLIIRAGMNIYPQEVEATLLKDPRVYEVLVYATEHPYLGTQLGMKVCGDFDNCDELRELCIELLPPFQIPILMELVDELPKNGSGKIIRKVG